MSEIESAVANEAQEAAVPIAAAVAEIVAEEAVADAVAEAVAPVVEIVAELAETVADDAREIADREGNQWLVNELQAMEERLVTRLGTTLAAMPSGSPSEEAATNLLEAEAAILEAQAEVAEEEAGAVVEQAELNPLPAEEPAAGALASRRRPRGLKRR